MKTHHELIFLVVDTRVLGCVAVGRLVARAASFCDYTIIYQWFTGTSGKLKIT